MPGWPQKIGWMDYRSPVICDVNNDGKLDIVTTAGNGFSLNGGGVYAWNFDGSLINGFPKVTEVDAQAAASIADIDNDGYVELMASSSWDTDLKNGESKRRSSIYIWELDSKINDADLVWPMFHHDTLYSGYYD